MDLQGEFGEQVCCLFGSLLCSGLQVIISVQFMRIYPNSQKCIFMEIFQIFHQKSVRFPEAWRPSRNVSSGFQSIRHPLQTLVPAKVVTVCGERSAACKSTRFFCWETAYLQGNFFCQTRPSIAPWTYNEEVDAPTAIKDSLLSTGFRVDTFSVEERNLEFSSVRGLCVRHVL